MRIKTALYQVMCLVITAMLHLATAQYSSIAIEGMTTNIIQKFEQTFIEKLLEQFEEVVEKLGTHTTNIQQIAESIMQLRNITDNLLAGQQEIQSQLTSVKNDLQHHKSHVKQDKACDNKNHKLQNSTNVQYDTVIDKLIARALNAQLIDESNVNNEPIERGEQSRKDVTPSSCGTLKINATDTYYIQPDGAVQPFLVLCDFEENFNLGGGWTVFQHRYNGAVEFYQNWTTYKNGFGDVSGEHWLGLEKLHVMTRSGRHELLIVLEDHEGRSAYALYDSFLVGSEAETYKLTVGNYSGTAGDSLIDHNGMKFSTFDQDNDLYAFNCANQFIGAWWFNACYKSHLNGEYFRTGEDLEHGVIWKQWRGLAYSLKSTKMMLRLTSGQEH